MGCSVNIVVLNLAFMVIASCVVAMPANNGAPRGSLLNVVVDGVEYSPQEFRRHNMQRNMLLSANMWPIGENGTVVVPYRYGVGVNRDIMELALRKWEKDTCIRFREMAPNEVLENNFLDMKFKKQCTSTVGAVSDGPTVIHVEDACGAKGFLHELAHALGFTHEQNRNDRDKYVRIYQENVDPKEDKNYYVIERTEIFDVPFDYNSIMIGSEAVSAC
ncbi:astacin-like metalloendopeptidase [Hyalella azteca]|uniref:Metalloendopeptidase n=1 Tax=Hyalella azteca TaxID=294128 RepID=A0A8B7N2B6_HYAAZ|nr:astacin-like metalloendopeptidase [Hyalella azteca]